MKSWKMILIIFANMLLSMCLYAKGPLTSADIRIRDPFVLADKTTQTYYLYAQMDNRLNKTDKTKGVEVYQSRDLKTWTGPEPVFVIDDDFWAQSQVWAPEVHKYNNKYYLFVTFTDYDTLTTKKPGPKWPTQQMRGTQILVADSPTGPFKPFHNRAHTPLDWMALDGTLYVENNQPYMVFCHEWIQIQDGTMELVKIKNDLSDTVDGPVTLFKASQAPWVIRDNRYVTDGAFLYTTQTGKLLMIWSSFGSKGYAIGIAESTSGSIQGPWIQHEQPLFKEDGGHGMIFKTFNDELVLIIHQPNKSPLERMKMFYLQDTGECLKIIKE